MLITDKKILKTHAYCFLDTYYDFVQNNKSEKITLITQLTHLRPLIEYYQKKTNDKLGEKLDLISKSLKSQYFSACKMIHPESHFVYFNPKELKHDFKLIYKSIFGKKEYKKLRRQLKYNHFGPKSLLSLYQ